MDTLETIAVRKSVRSYKREQIGDEALATIIKAGQSAPNAGPFQISAIQKTVVLKQLSEVTRTGMKNSGNTFLMQRVSLPGYDPIYGAPTVLLLSAPDDNVNSAANTALAAENMILAATALGLGTCYLGSPGLAFAGKEARELTAQIGIPETYAFKCAIAIGYSAGDAFGTSKSEKGTVNYVK